MYNYILQLQNNEYIILTNIYALTILFQRYNSGDDMYVR